MPGKVLQRTYSTRFNDFALEFYSFVADNYAPYYSRPVECTDRDALSLPFIPSRLPTMARLSGTDITLSQWIL